MKWKFWKKEEEEPIKESSDHKRLIEIMRYKNKDHTIDEIIEEVETYKNLGEYWNSYACNAMSHESVDNSIKFFKFLSGFIPYEDIKIIASGDSGHIYKMPPGGKSGMMIYLQNTEKWLEIEFDKNEIFIWGYSHKWNKKKKQYDIKSYDWPWLDEDSYIKEPSETIEYLKWFDPKILAFHREKEINKLL